MRQAITTVRPRLEPAVQAWKKLLAERGLATDLLWFFEDNLCFERKPDVPGGIHIGFQTRFSPVPPEALDVAYEHFCEAAAPIVFYRLGESAGRSVCILLADSWFGEKKEADGFVVNAKWGIWFYPGQKIEIEEITDMRRWIRRLREEGGRRLRGQREVGHLVLPRPEDRNRGD